MTHRMHSFLEPIPNTEDAIMVICNENQWRLSSVSALNNLQYDTIKLKQYASKVKHSLTSLLSNKNGSSKYIVQFDPISNLKYVEDDPDALFITVGVTQAHSDSKAKVVYRAIFMCWGEKCSLPDAIHLPYLLEKGEQKVGNCVKTTVSTIFDCNIFHLSFTENHLLNMALYFVETLATRKKIGFTYAISHADHKQKLDLNFDVEQIYQIMASLKEEVQNPKELRGLTFKMLQNQIFHMFNLDIGTLSLIDVTFPGTQIKANGTIKMKSPEIVKCVFNILNEICKSNFL